MYRVSKTTSSNSSAINSQCADSDSTLELTNTPTVTAQPLIRSTSQILNLIKRPNETPKRELCVKKNILKPSTNNSPKTEEKQLTPPVPVHNKIVFNVLIGKKSTRKHKVWDDDGILEVTGKNVILKSSDGNVLGRTTVDPGTLEEGFRLSMNNKEVEIVDKVLGDICPSQNKEDDIVQEPPLKKQKVLPKKAFVPLGPLKKESQPLIMPSISSSREWSEHSSQKSEQEVSVDPCLADVLRPHQREGVIFLYQCIMGMKAPNFFGAILADEMGLGKTLQCITILWTLMRKGPYGKPVIKRVLIVTPSSLCGNWDKEFSRWLGYHRISPYVVNAKHKAKDFKTQMRNPVMIISYDMLIRNFEDMDEIAFDLMICDEGHRLKNTDIKAVKILSDINCKKRILLTGTPIQNDLQEFFALIDFVNPGILSTNQEYKRYYESPIVASRCPHASESAQSIGKERAEELYKKTSLFILRRTQETINKYLPSKHEIIVFCRLSAEQERCYRNTTDTWFSKAVLPHNNVPHLTVITALKKICNNQSLLGKENENSKLLNETRNYDGKVSVVQTLMRNLRKTDEKLVLISYFTQTLDYLEEICNKGNFKFLRLDGSTSTKFRTKIVEQFNQRTDDHKIFLLSAKAGGVGLNLPGASRLVLFDSDWNPASDSQAMARIWRDGQKKDVYIYRLLSTGTIEEKIFQRQISKSGLSETVVDSKSFASLKFSMAELKDLFTLTTNTDCLTHDMMKCPCNGRQSKAVESRKIDEDDLREFQLVLEDDVPKRNLSINHLLEWEHYVQPVPTNVMQDIMLEEISQMITFVFKNSIYQGNK